MSTPSMPAIPAMPTTPSQEEIETRQRMQESEQERKSQIMNMRGRTSTIGTSALGDTSEISGFKVSLLGGA